MVLWRWCCGHCAVALMLWHLCHAGGCRNVCDVMLELLQCTSHCGVVAVAAVRCSDGAGGKGASVRTNTLLHTLTCARAAGDVLGEMAILGLSHDGRRMRTSVCQTMCELCVLEKDDLMVLAPLISALNFRPKRSAFL